MATWAARPNNKQDVFFSLLARASFSPRDVAAGCLFVLTPVMMSQFRVLDADYRKLGFKLIFFEPILI